MARVEPGSQIGPTLRLVRQLGQGGMGSVWIADHLALRTQVVVKFLSENLADNPVTVDRFSREAAAAAQVKSPHVVQMLDHGITPHGVPFIVMELLDGNDFGKLLDTRRVLSPHETATIIGQVCKALSRAHERGIVHRDIKPENIFLCDVGSDEPFVKLLDFGIAKSADPMTNATKTGAVMGTPYYMSPEQTIGSKTIDYRTDLWSLGIVAYEAMTGMRAFDGDTIGALSIAIHAGPIPIPSRANPSLGPGIDAWFARACAREVQARFSSAKEMADALTQVARAQPASTAAPMPLPSAHAPSPNAPRMQTTGGASVGAGTIAPPKQSSSLRWIVLATSAAFALSVSIGAYFALSGGKKPSPTQAGKSQGKAEEEKKKPHAGDEDDETTTKKDDEEELVDPPAKPTVAAAKTSEPAPIEPPSASVSASTSTAPTVAVTPVATQTVATTTAKLAATITAATTSKPAAPATTTKPAATKPVKPPSPPPDEDIH